MKNHMRQFAAALVVSVLAISVGLWRANSGGGDSFIAVGPLRVVSAKADTTSAGSVTSQQALSLVIAKLTELSPTVDWSSPTLAPTWTVVQVSNLQQVTDSTTGRVLYTRPWPLTAWVVEVRMNGSYGFGLVSDSPNLPWACTARTGCEPPGQLMAAQAFLQPPVRMTLPTVPPCTTIHQIPALMCPGPN
jgi:hypothetical protein